MLETAFKSSCSDENRAAHFQSSLSELAFLCVPCLLLINRLESFRWEHKAGRIL